MSAVARQVNNHPGIKGPALSAQQSPSNLTF